MSVEKNQKFGSIENFWRGSCCIFCQQPLSIWISNLMPGFSPNYSLELARVSGKLLDNSYFEFNINYTGDRSVINIKTFIDIKNNKIRFFPLDHETSKKYFHNEDKPDIDVVRYFKNEFLKFVLKCEKNKCCQDYVYSITSVPLECQERNDELYILPFKIRCENFKVNKLSVCNFYETDKTIITDYAASYLDNVKDITISPMIDFNHLDKSTIINKIKTITVFL